MSRIGDSWLRPMAVLETVRLRLRPLGLRDAEDIYDYARDPHVAATTSWTPHPDVAFTRRYIERVLKAYRDGDPAPWGVELRESGRVIGTCGFTEWYHRHGRAALGYALARAHWGRGYTTEAVAAVIRHGFITLQFNRIEAMCLPDNHASARVMEKTGMRYEGLLRQYLRVKGEFVDLKLYAIL
jgi:ribosomal-protein-alanine N-acetyltransferase